MSSKTDAIAKSLLGQQSARMGAKPGSVRARKRKRVSEAATGPFIAWDGEGVQWKPGKAQPYSLFGCSIPDRYIVADRTGKDRPPELRTRQIFNLMLDVAEEYPGHVHIGFSTVYDVNQMLCDLTPKQIRKLHKTNSVTYASRYYIRCLPRKFITIYDLELKRSIKLYDLFTFFGKSFIASLEEFEDQLKVAPEDWEIIVEGKAGRSAFRYEDMAMIQRYWGSEIRALAALGECFRNNLVGAGIELSEWHGPGAIANKLFGGSNGQFGTGKAVDISEHMTKEQPDEVREAAQYAYAGGRFEQFKVGNYLGPVYVYDIRSAYPYWIAQLPSLKGKEFQHVSGKPVRPARFGLYRIEYVGDERGPVSKPQPLFFRISEGPHKDGIVNPRYVHGWYWTPEAELIWDNPNYAVHEAWELDCDESEPSPFEWVKGMYSTRRAWKDDGNPSQLALKLGLNSLYGKMAQRVGGKTDEKGNIIAPPQWHQLEWAGYVTSGTRSMIYKADMLAWEKGGLVANETDSVIATCPIELDLGKELGQWEESRYSGLTYLQSGMYWLRLTDADYAKARKANPDAERWLQKSRGMDKVPKSKGKEYGYTVDGELKLKVPLTRDKAMRYLRRPGKDVFSMRKGSKGLAVTTSRYVGMGRAVMSPKEENFYRHWRKWVTEDKVFKFGVQGKRAHEWRHCKACKDGVFPSKGLHDLNVNSLMATWARGFSGKHRLPWLGDISTDELLEKQLGREMLEGELLDE